VQLLHRHDTREEEKLALTVKAGLLTSELVIHGLGSMITVRIYRYGYG